MEKKKIKFNIKVHYSVKNRKKWKIRMWLYFILMVLLLLGASALMMFGGYSWNPQEGFSPSASPSTTMEKLYLALGIVLAIGAIVGCFLICFVEIRGFYTTQKQYFQSKEFKDHKTKALDVDLKLLKKKDLKWYKKLGYINSSEFRNALEEQSKLRLELKKQGKKIKYAHSRA